MPLVVRYVEPRCERHPSAKQAIPRPSDEPNLSELPEEYHAVDRLLSVTSCLPILETVSTNQLQALTVHRISSLIRQLSSLAQHAESVMGDIAEGLVTYHARSVQLEVRIKRLTEEVLPSLDPELEAMEGFEIPHPDFQFKSRRDPHQLALTKYPPPPPLLHTIQYAHSPPLHLLSELWPDGRNAMHLYSNPDYFFEQWRISVQQSALRRKSSAHLLSPTSPTHHSKSNGAPGGRFPSATPTRGDGTTPTRGSTKLRRSATVVSRSSRKKPRPLSYHSSSNLSLQDVGLSAGKHRSKGMQRTFSMRAPPGYAGVARKSVRIPKSKHLADPLSKSIAAVYPHIEVSPADGSGSDKDSLKSDSKFQRGSGLRRSFSLRRSRSRSKSPNPPTSGTPESMLSSSRLQAKESTSRDSSSDVSLLPRKQVEPVTSDSSLSAETGSKTTSTFKSSSSLTRSVTPLLTRVATPPIGKPWQRTNSDARELSKPSLAQRSLTVSVATPNLRNVAAKVRDRLKNEGRPASVSLDVHIDPPMLNEKTSSQSSLVNIRTPSSQSNSSANSSRPRSMLVGDVDMPLSQELASKLAMSSQSRKPRRPAPHRPAGQNNSGRGTPDSGRKERTTPTLNASPVTMTMPDAAKANSTNSSPVPAHSSEYVTGVQGVGITGAGPGVGVAGGGSGGPPPPPQRNDSLSSVQKTAQGAAAGSGPATPGSARTAQVHSSLDTERRQSMATALSEVLANMSRRSFPLSPTSPPVPLVNGDLNRTLTPDKNRTLSPIDHTPQGRGVVDLDATLTPFESSPQFKMSPISSVSPQTGTFGPSPRGKIHPSMRRFSKRQSSLYISPHKLTEVNETGRHSFKQRADQILKAGGVDNGFSEDSSRSDLLAAIRKGIQLKKVEQEATHRIDEVSWDVAAILERYEVLHSDSDDESDYGDDEWLDD